ncbi:MAG: GSCFA domain-containing protein [Prevotellaceae bacterium]|jgi:hypothetical protein|nr:GSCFA domain-containing protein [Prevotellaceae bacterium]
MVFRTEFEIPELSRKLNYATKALFIGSCFTSNIGECMQRYKFPADVNPFGVIYNPLSIINSLELLQSGYRFGGEELLYQNGLWFSYTHHSSFSSPDKEQCLSRINRRMRQSTEFLQQADFLFITLGTAYAYKLKKTGKVVANCHKTPTSEFDRMLLSTGEIIESFRILFDSLLRKNPSLNIIFSVSPVRHLKDSAHGNQLSKASLLLAIDELQKQYTGACFYFPAYELLLDDLRDYRFYANDMRHLSEQAIKYIREKFNKAVISADCIQIMNQVESIVAAANHRPFNTDSEQYKAFQQKTIDKIYQLQAQYPFMNFTSELETLQTNRF